MSTAEMSELMRLLEVMEAAGFTQHERNNDRLRRAARSLLDAQFDGNSDTERLNFMIVQNAHLAWSRDHEVCHVARWADDDGSLVHERLGPTSRDGREAIDRAIEALPTR
ncbi:hypothetical protein [Burkholderia sp. Tr-20390]|uniref:hypothetical protein n=1 Tax=Burkholderia sp. Tr-20390 TaxID=2703904 RepID=UPI00197D7DB6|nr:hypothetical protein [Burkholderia sp. Tr-20390]MBN3729472.1 hypothetical protein [Burkholderia sp. Tr-20390]